MSYKLLLVDDEKDIIESLSPRLIREGYEVSAAFDGHEALEKVKQTDPDIIILDLMLPGLNGFEVLEKIRKEYTDKWRPIIIMSAKDEMKSWEKCHNLEADLYLTKPCTIYDILHGIKTMISLIPVHKTQDNQS